MATKPEKKHHSQQLKKKLYKSYLISYAQRRLVAKKNTHSVAFTLPTTVIRFHQWAVTSSFQNILRYLHLRTQKSYQQASKRISLIFSLNLSKKTTRSYHTMSRWLRLAYRWNRKQQMAFTSELARHASIKKNWLFQVVSIPFQPFYYSFRLFPLHSVIAITISIGLFASTYFLHELIFKDLPSVMELTTQQPAVSSKILDRTGKVLYTMYKEENRTIVPLQYISPHLINATIAIEDKEFYNHQGFSIRGISRAALTNFQEGRSISQGGSTITQQLVKMRLLSSERTFTRKVKELILAVLVEGAYSKDEILSMYLNQVPYGGATYGIEEASRRYFGKSSAKLTIAEAALLAGLPQAPSVYSPYGSYPDLAKNRQLEVLRRMVEDGYISQADADTADQEKLAFRQDSITIQAPHFVMYVRELLGKEYGEEQLLTQGLEIRTSLDLELQNEVQSIVTKEIAGVQHFRITNGAAIVTNPQTGEVLAMVGSKNYFDFANDGQVNVTIEQRQPGSSIKPVTYAMALERGNTVTSLIQDQPVVFKIPGSEPYAPKNYDGKFHGNVTLKEALASSYNIPAVKLLESVGVSAMINKAEAMGITTWQDRKRFGLALTLGGGEVRMVDMASVYGAFANQGVSMKTNPILEIKNYKGESLYENTCALYQTACEGKKVLDPKIAFLISNILSDNKARTPAFGSLSDLFIPGQEVAVKTGTTNNRRDNWTFGYTKDRLTAVWVGNNDGSPMSYVASGVTGASPIWNKIMHLLLDDTNPHTFAVPAGIVKVSTCFRGAQGTRISEEYYIAGTEPASNCKAIATKKTSKKAVTAQAQPQ
jgi:1A family penicillin-binding protein